MSAARHGARRPPAGPARLPRLRARSYYVLHLGHGARYDATVSPRRQLLALWPTRLNSGRRATTPSSSRSTGSAPAACSSLEPGGTRTTVSSLTRGVPGGSRQLMRAVLSAVAVDGRNLAPDRGDGDTLRELDSPTLRRCAGREWGRRAARGWRRQP